MVNVDYRNIAQGVSRIFAGKVSLVVLLGAVIMLPVVGLAVSPEAPPKPAPQAAPVKAVDDISRVESYLADIKSLTARFIQQAPDGSTTEGTLTLLRPGKLRFEYQPEVPLLVVSDGSTLTFVDYSVKQVTRWPISDTPLGVLVAKDVDLKNNLQATTHRDKGGLLYVKIVDPKRKDEGYITLIFENQPLTLKAWQVTDAQGLETRVNLLDTAYNVDVSNKSFTFKDPRSLPQIRRGAR